MNNVDTGSPDKRRGRNRDTANVDLDLDMDSGNSEEDIHENNGDDNKTSNFAGKVG